MSTNRNNLLFVKLLYLLSFTGVFILVFSETKKALHLEINEYHSEFADTFFKYATYLGDGLMFAFVIIISFFRNRILALTFSISGILTLVLTQFFKKVVFSGTPRPVELIGKANLHLVEGVKMAHWNSFPSGHTTAAFTIATILIFQTRNKWMQLFILILAMLAGFSRVYLSQHFLVDVLAGSALGIFIGLLSLQLVELIRKRRN